MLLDIQAAALALDISPNTVRRRLAKGLLRGNKVGNKWQVEVEEAAPGRNGTAPDEPTALVDALQARVDAQEREISELHQLMARNALAPPPGALRRLWRWLI